MRSSHALNVILLFIKIIKQHMIDIKQHCFFFINLLAGIIHNEKLAMEILCVITIFLCSIHYDVAFYIITLVCKYHTDQCMVCKYGDKLN